jgi:hypothetical protein
MADLAELYRRVEICERLIPLCRQKKSGHGSGQKGMGERVKYYSIMFPYQNEALVRHNGVDYTINYGFISGRNINDNDCIWINISKPELLFLDKTIQNNEQTRHVLRQSFTPEVYAPERGDFLRSEVATDTLRSLLYNTPQHIKIDLWNEMISQLIPANPDAVETITRETINEALFETRLKIHNIKNTPPRMNQLMYTVSPPITPRPLTPRPITPRPLTPRIQLVPRENHLLSVQNQPLRRRTRRNKNRMYSSVTL